MNNGYGQQIVSTKANTLYALSKVIKKSKIEKMYILPVAEFENNRENVLRDITETYGGEQIIVRSSSSKEDSFKTSNAGHYESILGINSGDSEQVNSAIEKVIASYQKDIEILDHEQILVQRQAQNVKFSGVIFTRDIQGNRPYYLINYDDQGSTDSVTSGSGGKTLWIVKNASISEIDEPWGKLIDAVQEIELFLNGMALDIEFAINEKGEIIIFQVRPLVASYKQVQKMDDGDFFSRIKGIKEQYNNNKSVLNGRTMMFSDMAFWNPSEIIGSNPRSLEYSLYEEILLKHAWNQGIAEIGYRRLPNKLMFKLGNKPYISVEYSFYSLLPQSLDEKLALKLVDFYCNKLKKDLTAHDKIEFEIAYTTYDFCTEKNSRELLENGFSKEERDTFLKALFTLTNDCLTGFKELTEKDLLSLKLMDNIRQPIEEALDAGGLSTKEMFRSIMILLDAITRYGTPQFTRQARLAFISKALCRSFVSAGYFTSGEIDDFMMSIYTVAAEYDADFQDLVDGRITRVEFDERYGHLRSGTYDITCDTYEKREFDMNKGSANARKQRQRLETLKHNPLNVLTIIDALDKLGFYVDATEFVEFLKESMEEREYFKFEFTKSLSLALDILADLGEYLGLTREEMSYLTFNDIVKCANIPEEDIAASFKADIDKNRSEYRTYSELVLPDRESVEGTWRQDSSRQEGTY